MMYFLNQFLGNYLTHSKEDSKALMLHYIIMGIALIAGQQMIMGNGKKFVDDASRFV